MFHLALIHLDVVSIFHAISHFIANPMGGFGPSSSG
jgi:hypothetical protein